MKGGLRLKLDSAALIECITQKNFSITALSERCGYEPCFLRRLIKRGTVHPRTALVLSMALDVAVEDITRSQSPPPRLPDGSRCVVVDRYAIDCALAYADMTLKELGESAHCAAAVLISRGWCERNVAEAMAKALGVPPEEIIIESE